MTYDPTLDEFVSPVVEPWATSLSQWTHPNL